MSRARSLAGESALPLSEIRQTLFALAEEERETPVAASVPTREEPMRPEAGFDTAPDFPRCRLAVYAWVDETLLNAARPDAAAWTAMSLQHAFFQTSEAGTLFFTHLGELLDRLLPLADDAAVEKAGAPDWLVSQLEAAAPLRRETSPARRELDVYALCLLLGFRGRYFDAPEFCERLRQAARKILTNSEGIRSARAHSQGRRWRMDKPLPPALEWLLYALLPLAATLLFGFYCADLLVDLPRIRY
ncbi:MAG: DotU family type IV/VI secretion system protein [Azoarcus sp.]|nr:DotU family type IV/VI secretion system protein [Azoarcus sp.]